jgi:hypothetical protein
MNIYVLHLAFCVGVIVCGQAMELHFTCSIPVFVLFKLFNSKYLPNTSLFSTFNLLKPTCYVNTKRFSIHEFYILPHCIYVFCIYLKPNSDFCPIEHKLIGFIITGMKSV